MGSSAGEILNDSQPAVRWRRGGARNDSKWPQSSYGPRSKDKLMAGLAAVDVQVIVPERERLVWEIVWRVR